MLWLQFPGGVDILDFANEMGTPLKDMAKLGDKESVGFVLMHLVYSTTEKPRAVIYDQTDALYMPINFRGFHVCIPYLVPKTVIAKVIGYKPPVSQPGPLKSDITQLLQRFSNKVKGRKDE